MNNLGNGIYELKGKLGDPGGLVYVVKLGDPAVFDSAVVVRSR